MVRTGLSRKIIRTKHIRGNSEFYFLLINERLCLLKTTVFILSLLRSHILICTFVQIHLGILSFFFKQHFQSDFFKLMIVVINQNHILHFNNVLFHKSRMYCIKPKTCYNFRKDPTAAQDRVDFICFFFQQNFFPDFYPLENNTSQTLPFQNRFSNVLLRSCVPSTMHICVLASHLEQFNTENYVFIMDL